MIVNNFVVLLADESRGFFIKGNLLLLLVEKIAGGFRHLKPS